LNFTSPGPVALQTSNQANQPHGHPKNRNKKKENIQDQNKKPNTISLNLCNKNWPVLKNMLITCERM
jgi:hypothetical protein